jgi:hypothetical protein
VVLDASLEPRHILTQHTHTYSWPAHTWGLRTLGESKASSDTTSLAAAATDTIAGSRRRTLLLLPSGGASTGQPLHSMTRRITRQPGEGGCVYFRSA